MNDTETLPTTNAIEPDDRGLVRACPQCGQRNRLPYERLGHKFRCGKCHTDLAPPGQPVALKDDAVFDLLTGRSSLPVLVDFWAPWCGPCKMIAPELAKVAAEGAGRWLIAQVNTEELQGPAVRLSISALPTLVLFRNGRKVGRRSGVMSAAAIRQFIEQTA
jgi:thioredoxin 2